MIHLLHILCHNDILNVYSFRVMMRVYIEVTTFET